MFRDGETYCFDHPFEAIGPAFFVKTLSRKSERVGLRSRNKQKAKGYPF
jgi:hypothetical protein